MRTIKFKAWDTDEKYMYDVPLQKLQYYPQGRYTLLQFTGLLDKNGKEIYEEDVLKHFDIEPKVVVRWDDFLGGFLPLIHLLDFPEEKTLEVIGNIYENPELWER